MDSTKSLTEIVTWLFTRDPMDDPAVQHRARLLFVDTLGCMIAGLAKPARQAPRPRRSLVSVVVSLGRSCTKISHRRLIAPVD